MFTVLQPNSKGVIWVQRYENGRLTRKYATDLNQNRIRFNWGFHDGAHEQEHYNGPGPQRVRQGEDWQAKHHDPIYIEGYKAGQLAQMDGTYENNSQPAWAAAGIPEGVTTYNLTP